MEENNSVLKKIKEYLPLIILIPTLIGGTIQVIQLLQISSTFIRFFSITQALSDGLLSLTFIGVISLVISLFLLFQPWYSDLKKEVQDSKLKEWIKKALIFLIDLIVYTGITFSIAFCVCFFIRSDFKMVEVFYVLLLISVFSGFFFSVIMNVKKDKPLNNVEKKSSPINWNHIITYYITILFFVLYVINKANSHVYDVYNKENLYCYLDHQKFKHDIEDYEIHYFNDTYIFVELYFKDTIDHPLPKNQAKSITTVLKFDTFFDFEVCTESKTKP